jgi:hypothetical protein
VVLTLTPVKMVVLVVGEGIGMGLAPRLFHGKRVRRVWVMFQPLFPLKVMMAAVHLILPHPLRMCVLVAVVVAQEPLEQLHPLLPLAQVVTD